MDAKAALVSALLLAASATALAEEPPPPCKGAPTVVAACFSVHGRLAVYNGIPIRIWVVGTRRMLGVRDAAGGGVTVRPEILRLLSQGEPGETVVYGDYEVCPLTKTHPGWMQFVCVEGAAHLVARPRAG
ncbi:MAG TPA: hypothetical protein VN823_27270 [Stellaceae bacterium]|nr:hypothetical protein [Stellaceae bacterium]